MYKLAIVPKIHHSIEYSSAYGSQHDRDHLLFCLSNSIKDKQISFDILYENDFEEFCEWLNFLRFWVLTST